MPEPQAYAEELSIALRVVHVASLLTKSVLRSLHNRIEAETKPDDTPVTIADYASQAIIISALHASYPSDNFVGEESSAQLREDGELADRVWALVQQSQLSYAQHHTENPALTFPASKNEMLDIIDLGTNDRTAEGRVWVMDPIDGTATFMTNNQYAVCLCLLHQGRQQLAVVACPNLAFDVNTPIGQTKIHEDSVDGQGHGVVLSAIKGCGTYVRKMDSGLGEARRVMLQHAHKPMDRLDFVEVALGKTSLSQPDHRSVADDLGAKWPGTVLWSQQMKYVALALGATDVMVRVPTSKDRYTYTYDHAGGQLLYEEAGGTVKDLDGDDIDFSQGRRINGTVNFGMIASMPEIFDDLQQTVKRVLARKSR